MIQKIDETKIWFFENINKFNKRLARLTKKQKKEPDKLNHSLYKRGWGTTTRSGTKMLIPHAPSHSHRCRKVAAARLRWEPSWAWVLSLDPGPQLCPTEAQSVPFTRAVTLSHLPVNTWWQPQRAEDRWELAEWGGHWDTGLRPELGGYCSSWPFAWGDQDPCGLPRGR